MATCGVPDDIVFSHAAMVTVAVGNVVATPPLLVFREVYLQVLP